MPYDKEKFAEYPLKGIPVKLWDRVRAAAKAEGTTMREFTLAALREKLANDTEGR